MRTTNKKSREFVQERLPFKASNLSGADEASYYVVYSYGWYELFIYSYVTRQWYENKDKYSPSTIRQKSQCHPRMNTIEMTHEELKQVKNYGINERVAL